MISALFDDKNPERKALTKKFQRLRDADFLILKENLFEKGYKIFYTLIEKTKERIFK